MLELADRLLPLLRAGAPVAVATCIDVLGSAPHAIGTSMALAAGGVPIGSVAGGCAESAALADCRAVLAGGPPVVRRSGFERETAAVAACGGEVDLLTVRIDAAGARRLIPQLERALRGDAATVVLVTGGRGIGAMGTAEEPPHGVLRSDVRSASASGPLTTASAVRAFAEVRPAAPRLLLIGATETAAAVSAAAAALGHVVEVVDVRPDFARPERFPAARRVLTARPHEAVADFRPTSRDAVVLLSHDEDLDALALAAALESGAGYVGAQGSRATTERRVRRLRDLGVGAEGLDRLHAPIGLDVGSRTPEETAVSILAELLAVTRGAPAAPLRSGAGPIHRRATAPADA